MSGLLTQKEPSIEPPTSASLCFVTDVVRPLCSLARNVAALRRIDFLSSLEAELPGVRVSERRAARSTCSSTISSRSTSSSSRSCCSS